uniref:Rab3-GAP regulatory subunit N-terminal domain-containing protein n=1 Tax=Meloidogyne incognita TaxID=6306 RepID=A0A914LGZ4_MELIC
MVIVDNIGRILLVNTKMRRILRIWKGYRQARCGWIEKQQKCSAPHQPAPSKALFLIIYVPRRGLLEVWSMQNGPRISAFEVDDGRLISINYGILCGNDEILEGNKSNSSKSSNVIFLSAEGLFYSIDVPFNSSNNQATNADKSNLIKSDHGLN